MDMIKKNLNSFIKSKKNVSQLVALSCCANTAHSTQRKQIDDMIKMKNITPNIRFDTALIWQCMESQQPKIITSNAMVAAYTQNGHYKEAFELFHQVSEHLIKLLSMLRLQLVPTLLEFELNGNKSIDMIKMKNITADIKYHLNIILSFKCRKVWVVG